MTSLSQTLRCKVLGVKGKKLCFNHISKHCDIYVRKVMNETRAHAAWHSISIHWHLLSPQQWTGVSDYIGKVNSEEGAQDSG